jgi:hypothetical protein
MLEGNAFQIVLLDPSVSRFTRGMTNHPDADFA